jgi:hypothetical protein
MRNHLPARIAVFLLSLILVAAGCRLACREGSGPVREERRSVEAFHSLVVTVPATIVVHHGSEPRLTVKAQEEILEVLETSVSRNRLRIGSTRCYAADQPVTIEVETPDLQSVELSGSGAVQVADTFQTDRFSVEVSGSGEVEVRVITASLRASVSGSGKCRLTGSANEVKTAVAGSGSIDAVALPCNRAKAAVSGSGRLSLYVLESLNASVAGSGRILYRGNPDVKSSVAGSGKVINDNPQ